MTRNNLLLFGICMVLILMVVSVSAVQIRPINQIKHPGIDNPYHPPRQGPNHVGVSDYSNVWMGISQLCEQDTQYRPINQGKNILKFFFCGSNEEN